MAAIAVVSRQPGRVYRSRATCPPAWRELWRGLVVALVVDPEHLRMVNLMGSGDHTVDSTVTTGNTNNGGWGLDPGSTMMETVQGEPAGSKFAQLVVDERYYSAMFVGTIDEVGGQVRRINLNDGTQYGILRIARAGSDDWQIHDTGNNTKDWGSNLVEGRQASIAWRLDDGDDVANLWVNGVLHETIPSVNLRAAGYNSRLDLNPGDSGLHGGSSLSMFLAWDRMLTDSELQRVTIDPWGMFQYYSTARYIPVASGGDTSGSFTGLVSTATQNTFSGAELSGAFVELASTTAVETQSGHHPAGAFVELASTASQDTFSGAELSGAFVELASTSAADTLSGHHPAGSAVELASLTTVDSFSGGTSLGTYVELASTTSVETISGVHTGGAYDGLDSTTAVDTFSSPDGGDDGYARRRDGFLLWKGRKWR